MMRGLKAANVPLVSTLPNFEEFYRRLTELSVTTGKVVGLTCSPDILQSIRRARANTALGVESDHTYSSMDAIRQELRAVGRYYRATGIPAVDVSHMATEEAAEQVLSVWRNSVALSRNAAEAAAAEDVTSAAAAAAAAAAATAAAAVHSSTDTTNNDGDNRPSPQQAAITAVPPASSRLLYWEKIPMFDHVGVVDGGGGGGGGNHYVGAGRGKTSSGGGTYDKKSPSSSSSSSSSAGLAPPIVVLSECSGESTAG